MTFYLYVMSGILQSLIEIVFVMSTLKRKYSVAKTMIIFIVVNISMFFITLSVQGKPLIKTPIYILVLTITIIFLTEGSKKKKAIIIISLFASAFLAEFISLGMYLIYVKSIQTVSIFDESRLIHSINFSVILSTLLMIFLIYWEEIRGYVKYKLLMLLSILTMYQLMMVLGMYYYINATMHGNILIFVFIWHIAIILSNYLMYSTINNMSQYIKNEQALEFLKKRNEFEYNYYQVSIENSRKLSALKHDFANQLQTAYALFLHDDFKDKSLAILESLEEKLSNIDKMIYCDNPVINAVLAVKTYKANKLKIDTDIKIQNINLEKTSEIDLCSIFSNLYDNAIEACEKIEYGAKRISIHVEEKKGYIIIKFINSYNGKIINVNDKIETSKEDKNNHGYGLGILKDIAKKYDGDIWIKYNKEIFETTIILSALY